VSDNALAVAVPAGYRDWRSIASLAVDAVSSAHSKRAYEKALNDFLAWYSAEARPPLSRAIVQQYRSVLESTGLAPPSINLRLSAIRKLAAEAAENDLLDRNVAQGIVSLKGVRQSGDRAGNWLSREQARDLLAQPDSKTTEGKRDRAILAVLLGCALRRSELAALDCGHLQQRDGRWVFVDLVGKGRRIRTVPIPPFVKVAIDDWTAAAGLSDGPLFRRVRRRKYPEKTPAALSERMIWHIVTKYARQTGLVDKLAPHDMRRTCAKLCRDSGGDLEQIQFLLGHASIQTTERYLGSRQNLKEAVNDRLGLDT
jgi:site-specific recombinase XerD